MRDRKAFEYAIVRVVPHVEREEFVNAGVIVFCEVAEFLRAEIDLDEARLRAIAPSIDIAFVTSHLDAIARICVGGPSAGPIGLLTLRERWGWLIAPRSTILQTSPAHAGVCDAPNDALARLMNAMVRRTK